MRTLSLLIIFPSLRNSIPFILDAELLYIIHFLYLLPLTGCLMKPSLSRRFARPCATVVGTPTSNIQTCSPAFRNTHLPIHTHMHVQTHRACWLKYWKGFGSYPSKPKVLCAKGKCFGHQCRTAWQGVDRCKGVDQRKSINAQHQNFGSVMNSFLF